MSALLCGLRLLFKDVSGEHELSADIFGASTSDYKKPHSSIGSKGTTKVKPFNGIAA
jgi:hypothetical protein